MPLFNKAHRLNVAFVNELERQIQRRGQVIMGLFINPKVVYSFMCYDKEKEQGEDDNCLNQSHTLTLNLAIRNGRPERGLNIRPFDEKTRALPSKLSTPTSAWLATRFHEHGCSISC